MIIKKKLRSDTQFSRAMAIRLLSMGFSQKDVADLLKVHKTSIGKFVRDNGIRTVDNKKSIGLHLKDRLTPDQMQWVYTKINASHNILDFMEALIKEKYTGSDNKEE